MNIRLFRQVAVQIIVALVPQEQCLEQEDYRPTSSQGPAAPRLAQPEFNASETCTIEMQFEVSILSNCAKS